MVAGERRVFGVVATAMPAGDDVPDMEGEKRFGALRQGAVFAAAPGSLTHQRAGGCVRSRRAAVGELAARLVLKHGDEIADADQILILLTLLR